MSADGLVVNREVLPLLPRTYCLERKLVPLDRIENTLLLAMANPGDSFAIDDVRFMTGFDVEAVPASETAVVQAIETHYAANDAPGEVSPLFKAGDAIDQFTDTEENPSDEPSEEPPPDSGVVGLVNSILAGAVGEGASHVHFDPLESRLRVSYRVDGVLREVASHPTLVIPSVISRMKILSKLDIAERRLPQDGRLTIRSKGRTIHASLCTLPTARGERIVVIILDQQAAPKPMDELGFLPGDVERLKQAVRLSSGLVLVAGPRRSGRSTTIYSVLSDVDGGARCILTAEDPIACLMEGVQQTQIKDALGYSYATALKAFMRQDPDVIMIQEIRDLETADAVLQAVLDGYLVLSAVEAVNAPSALLTLLQLGARPAFVGSAVRFVLAQRLVRKLCECCKAEYTPSKDQLDRLSMSGVPSARDAQFLRGAGCAACGQTGYRGRLPVCEILTPLEGLKAALLTSPSPGQARKIAVDEGMTTLGQNALRQAIEGKTTLDEYWRVIAETESF